MWQHLLHILGPRGGPVERASYSAGLGALAWARAPPPHAVSDSICKSTSMSDNHHIPNNIHCIGWVANNSLAKQCWLYKKQYKKQNTDPDPFECSTMKKVCTKSCLSNVESSIDAQKVVISFFDLSPGKFYTVSVRTFVIPFNPDSVLLRHKVSEPTESETGSTILLRPLNELILEGKRWRLFQGFIMI
jgi:hypothetical protein